jgi:thiol-disulfide isomerase/thioredoxin
LARPQAGLAVGLAWLAFSVAAAQLWIPAILESMSAEHMKRAAPPFSFTTLDGAKISNQSIHGRVAVLAFWATWCTPCREELPRLNAIYQRYAGDSSVAFLAVDSEGEGSDFESSAAKAKAFFSKRNLSMPIAVDTDSRARLGVHGLPSLLIIDRGGNIRLLHTGYDGSERLERMIGEQIATLVSSPTE